ncbi:DUF4270 domain-containing protein [Flavobacterium flavipallidum]|uniref:DUF4270 domain-containing protein n=1 Tax=Flavobacterium flavipallidum TaxID=3139140 RepID=A0ABU9HLQ4_9FLAO
MRNTSFFKIILLAITVVFFVSCDKDFNTIGGDLIGDEHFGLVHDSINVLSYNQKLDPVASNNLPVNPLGIYEDDVFGTTEANFVTQVVLASVNPTIGANPEIDSVYISIPYFSKFTYTETGDKKYELDSIFGNPEGKIKLSVYRSGYFMRDLDPLTGFLETQKYYTDQVSAFENLIVSDRLNNKDDDPSQNDQFVFSNKGFKDSVYVNGVKTLQLKDPEMRLMLDKAYFTDNILKTASGNLASNDVFKNYFRGLYFKVEKSGASPGRLAMMDFKKGTITINYKEDLVTTTNGQSTTTRVAKSIVLNLTGNTVSLLTNTKKPAYDTALNNPNKTLGDSQLYVKGGEGAMTVLDLFDKTDVKGYDANGNETVGMNHIPDQLDELRRKDPVTGKSIMINEANLVFHVDTTMGATKIPNRIYLYDLTNSTTIVDYLYDGTTGTNAKNGLLIYGGNLRKNTAGDYFYKINITNHIRSLVKNTDSTNVKLGVVVTENINNSAMNKLRSSFTLTDGKVISKVPQAAVMNPLGVVLYGGNSSVPDKKKLKLQIYYTKPN